MVSVEIFDRTGKKFGEITLDQRAANVAFGDPDRKTLYICARTGLYKARVDMSRRGDALKRVAVYAGRSTVALNIHSSSVSKS